MADHDDQTATPPADAPKGDATPDAPQGDATPDAPQGDAKARFRAALARKQDAAHRSAEGRQNTGVVHGSEVSGSGRRTFRRKTG